ncbi:FecR family protein [Methylogaea oryzae]|uniref:FecR family protein n=1 Tax=Methylogaea oryzae TaxID=1295382 RepID=UPI0006D0B0A0|nr:FecR domain-containing protein [Methylogaea oryzae]
MLVRLHSGDMAPGERLSLERWRARSAGHENAWREAEALWQGMDSLCEQAIPGSRPLPQESASAGRAFPRRRLPSKRWSAVAAAVALAWGLAIYPPARWLADYSTGTGQMLTVSLEDGSTVTLNTATALRVEFSENRRDIRLLSGEASFKVAKDAGRPFVVASDHGSARAVGTEFLVRETGDGLDVAVLEGTVSMEAGGQALLSHHQLGSYRQGAALRVDKAAPVENLAAWRDGYVIFDNTPLRAALAQIDRYRPGRVLLLNEKLADYRVSGVFSVDDIDRALRALGETTPARVAFVSSYVALVR